METQPPTQAAPQQEQNPKPPGAQVAVAVAGVLGAAVGYYCGIQLFIIPVALAFGLGWLLKRISSSPAAFREAWAIQAGYALWMAIGALLTGAWSAVALDLIVLAIGLIWLWARPGLGPVILLGLYQLAGGTINLVRLLGAEVASLQHKLLVVHLWLRVAAVAFLVAGYVKTRKQQSEAHGS